MLAQLIKEGKKVVVFTGAGMSTESGLPDFRSAKDGMWTKYDPSEVATVDALNSQFDTFIDFYRNRVIGVNEYGPHEGHYILADWERKGYVTSIITQNVDGFHQEAGSRHVIELHGTLKEVHCETCGKVYSNKRYEDEQYYCECGGPLRPSIVLFGEMLDERALMEAALMSEGADVFLVLGSSLTVSPANQYPLIAVEHDATLIIVNQDETQYDAFADRCIKNEKIGEYLRRIQTELQA